MRCTPRSAGSAPLLVALVVLAGAPLPALAQALDPAAVQELSMRHIGPFRGGRSVAVAGVAQDPLTYYMGGVGSGVWKTTDAGTTWRHVSDATFTTSSVGALAVAPSDPNVVWAGMGEHAIRGVTTSHGDGVYRSTDAGRSWTHLGLEDSRHIARIEVHPDDPDVAWVAVQGAAYGESEARGVYRTTDGGESWERVLHVGPTAGASEVALDPTNPRIVYAAFWDHLRQPWYVRSGGEGSGLWKSTDGGDSWRPIDEGLPELMGKTAVDVSPSNPQRLYAMIEADPGGGLYRSDDGGSTWSLMTGDWTLRARPWYYTEVYADPADDNTVYVLSAPMMRSIDGGRTFENVPTPHGDNHDLWINPSDSRVMINANDGGGNVSFNGGATWSTQANQPTVQFYRVAVDHQFPYRVYGGQQDNSTLSVASAAPGGIGMEDTYPVGGCESAFTAFDPDAPRLVYAGCYSGIITEYDHVLGAARDIKAYPTLPIALRADEMKYRFNWNAPIFVSPHDPRVVYHAGNHLLRSRDGGRSWEEASPDLTAADPAKLGYGGGPITNEGAGGEIYATLTYAAESPVRQGVLWTGSDDGRVHVSTDDGATWTDVTPAGMPEAQVNAIEASPHDARRAYIAVTAYKRNDFTPMAWRTDDGGRSWTRIDRGFGDEHWVRVVREDPVVPGLLYGGTEQGLYLSVDDGATWSPMPFGLPLSPVTDLVVQRPRNDLVVATSGWGFWVLDELSPLQQQVLRARGETAEATPLAVEGGAAPRAPAVSGDGSMLLAAPRDAFRVAGGGWGGGGGTNGRNPPNGAVLDLYVDEVPEGEARLEVVAADGTVVRRWTTASERDAADDRLELRAGHTRVVWDLRHPALLRIPDLYVFGDTRGQRVVPGRYTVRFDAAGETLEVPLRVRPDPRVDVARADYATQAALLAEIRREIETIHQGVIDVVRVRDQVDALRARADDDAGRADAGGTASDEALERLRTIADALVDSLTTVEDSLVQWDTHDGQTVLNAPSRIDFQYIVLWGNVEGADSGVTEGARILFDDLNARWWPLRSRLRRLLDEGIDRVNEAAADAGVAPVAKPAAPRIVS